MLRVTLPDADPYLFPLFAVLACFGLVMIYRIDDELAREQAQWFVIGLLLFAATIVLLRDDYRVLERYRYMIAAAGIALLLLPRLPGIGEQVNGAYLGVEHRAAVLPAGGVREDRDHHLPGQLPARHAPAAGHRRAALRGHHHPAAEVPRPAAGRVGRGDGDAVRHPGHRLVADVLRRLPRACSTWRRTGCRSPSSGWRCSPPARGCSYQVRPTIQNRVDAWLHPFDTDLYDRVGGSYQIAQSLFAQADGGVFGQGFGQALLSVTGPDGDQVPLLPAAQTDLIYAVITNELGLLGAGAVICVYLLVVERGFKIATLARRLVLQAAGHRPDRGVRAAGLRHRRRRHAASSRSPA